MERGGSSDVRWKTVPQTSGMQQQETLCRRQWSRERTDEYVERPETLTRQNAVVVWLQCLLVDEVRHSKRLKQYNTRKSCCCKNATTRALSADRTAPSALWVNDTSYSKSVQTSE